MLECFREKKNIKLFYCIAKSLTNVDILKSSLVLGVRSISVGSFAEGIN